MHRPTCTPVNAASWSLQLLLPVSHKPTFSQTLQTRVSGFLTLESITEVHLSPPPDKPHTKRLIPGAIMWLLSPWSRSEYSYCCICKQSHPKSFPCPWPRLPSGPSIAKDTSIIMNHPKHLPFNWAGNWRNLWTSHHMLKQSISSGPRGPWGFASRSCFSIHNHSHK